VISLKRLSIVLAVLAVLGLLQPTRALAGGETLKRAVGNLTQGPLDIALAPAAAGVQIWHNLHNIEDTTAVRVAYTAPGFLWITGLNAFAGVIRVVAGGFELLPGMGLLFTDREMTPLYAPAEKADALVQYDTRIYPVKFGVEYGAGEAE
jgi:hypothetical protein